MTIQIVVWLWGVSLECVKCTKHSFYQAHQIFFGIHRALEKTLVGLNSFIVVSKYYNKE